MMHTPPSTDSTLVTNGFSPVNGITMYYEMHGSNGDFLVLIHGGGSTIGTSFGSILPLLAKTNKVIAVELQAHGHTSDRDAPESFEQDADDVATLLKNLQIPKASFFGFSNGGNTAMQIAIRHPGIVDKLILASTFYKRDGLPHGFFEGMEQATIGHMPASLKTAFLQITPDNTRLQTMFNKDKARMLQFKDWKDEALRSIKAPTLIVTGDRDIALPAHAVAMSTLIENSRLMVLPAVHGSYMGVAEATKPEPEMLAMIRNVLEDFLKKQNAFE